METKRSVEELSFRGEYNSLGEIDCSSLQTLLPPNRKIDKILIQGRDGIIYYSLDGTEIVYGQGYMLKPDLDPVLIPQMNISILKVIGQAGSKLIYSWGY
jgi:hypothetical protein